MAYDVTKVHLGAHYITFNGNALGFTNGGVDIEIKTTTARQDIDHFGTVETLDIVQKREASIKFTVVEMTQDTLYDALTNQYATVIAGQVSNHIGVMVGAGTDQVRSTGKLYLHPVDRASIDTEEDLTFFAATWSGNMTMTSRVDDIRSWQLEFVAYADSSGYLYNLG